MEETDSSTGTGGSLEPGVLYIVATPIGNLADISARAEQVLSQAAVIAAEDTRHAKQLLARTDFSGKLMAYHDHSDDKQAEKLVGILKAGTSVALISDAGTPLISDPGFKLVRLARQQGCPVYPIPGPSALAAALSVAGIATDRFIFEGFLPSKEAARRKRLTELAPESRTLVFYESPHRILATVSDMASCLEPTRTLFLAREMTKKFEEHYFGELGECLRWLQDNPNRQKGEYSIVLAGMSEAQIQSQALDSALAMVSTLRRDLSLKRSVALAAEFTGARKNELYDRALKQEQLEN